MLSETTKETIDKYKLSKKRENKANMRIEEVMPHAIPEAQVEFSVFTASQMDRASGSITPTDLEDMGTVGSRAQSLAMRVTQSTQSFSNNRP